MILSRKPEAAWGDILTAIRPADKTTIRPFGWRENRSGKAGSSFFVDRGQRKMQMTETDARLWNDPLWVAIQSCVE